MSVREIDDYTQHAIGAGCFMNGAGRQRVRDEGGVRFERIFSLDRMLDYEDVGSIEIGEAGAKEIAHLLGWVDPRVHAEAAGFASTAAKEMDASYARVLELEEALNVLTKMNADLTRRAEASDEQVAKIKSEMGSMSAKYGHAKRKVTELEGKLKALENFGDSE